MANKIFSIYKSGKERTTKNNDRLVVEISNSHVASIVVGGHTNIIEDFEFFDIKAGNFKNFEEDFAYAVIGSRLLDKPYADKKVFINSPESVIIPTHLYSKEKSVDYLNVVFAENYIGEVFKDDLQNQFQVTNAYRIPARVREVIEKNLAIVTLEHTYSGILRNIFWNLSNLPQTLLKVQFYRSHFVVIVLNQQRLQIIQSYPYTTNEDVLYTLLNICRQLNLKTPLLQLSGMFDINSSLFETLASYFKNLVVEEKVVPDLNIDGYPAHYFTPFFKLAE